VCVCVLSGASAAGGVTGESEYAEYDPGARRSLPVRGKGEAHLQKMLVFVVGSPFRPVIADSGLW